MLFDMRGETVPKAVAIAMVNRTLKDDGHSPSARECVEIVDTLAAADGNNRVLNFTALEFWTVADRILYPRACECESASERADDTVPAEAYAVDFPGVIVRDDDGDYWKSNGVEWSLSLSLDEVERGVTHSEVRRLSLLFAPYVRVERLDSEGDEDRAGAGEDRLSEDDDPVLFNLCRMIDVLQRVLGVNDVSARDLFGGLSAIDLAKFALPEGAWDAYESTKAAR